MTTNNVEQSEGTWGRYFAIIGAILLSAIPASLILFLFNLYFLFEKLQVVGTDDPQLMSDGLANALVPVVLAIVFVIPALLCFAISIFVFQYYKTWSFWPTLAASLIALFLHPLALALGGSLLLTLYFKRDKFFNSTLEKVEQLSPTEF